MKEWALNMRIVGILMALISILAAGLGFMLRRQEVATVFDPVSGLAEQGASISILLIAFSIAVIALLFGLSFALPKKELPAFRDAFGGSLFSTISRAIWALAVLAFAGLELMELSQTGALDAFATVRLLAGLLAGLCLFLTAILGHRGVNVAIPAAMPVFWICTWLIVSHIERAADPVLLGYVYHLFALAALLLSLYYIAGYAFQQNRSGRLIFCSCAAIYFIGVTMADEMLFSTRLTFLALAATVLIYQLTLVVNLSRSDWKDIPYMERDMDEE